MTPEDMRRAIFLQQLNDMRKQAHQGQFAQALNYQQVSAAMNQARAQAQERYTRQFQQQWRGAPHWEPTIYDAQPPPHRETQEGAIDLVERANGTFGLPLQIGEGDA